MQESRNLRRIGRRENAALPDFGVDKVDVKIDSGAYTSSIHVSYCEERTENDKKILLVKFLDENHASYTGELLKFDEFRRKRVRSSNGQVQNRYLIKGHIVLGGEKILTEFSLNERGGMRYPVLLGRKLLNKRFVIDTSKTNILS